MSDSPAPLSIRGLTRRYGTTVAVDGLNLEVRPAEIVGFLGPNGAGKTTTLRCASGLLRADAGTIAIAGRALTATHAKRARRSASFPIGRSCTRGSLPTNSSS